MNITYDDKAFFEQYAKMSRSRNGLSGAGEWQQFRKLFPDVCGKRVLDLGCGYGWHCKYAVDQGAVQVLGIDISARMIEEARKRNGDDRITYCMCDIEEYNSPDNIWDLVISNLVLHYVADLRRIYEKIWFSLVPGGAFLFNIEHPVFTARQGQEWIRDEKGTLLYWPVDHYFYPGERKTHFLGCEVIKQHHTLTQILGGLLSCGFVIEAVEEAVPPAGMLEEPGMKDEMRRPMMLLVKVRKPE